ncbi:UNKNOWN [Stylonychia lemnae]|uniref:Uncharacterized protein n=1 Tax=Stylonychia lemnae TaxID=5949 RepID=A0A078B8R4_STYLE|nr:UNKNOWN [Stylonychia lemnae]|eukprot:CDW90616.1 UNKNOWN [Stylonychia lemnae]
MQSHTLIRDEQVKRMIDLENNTISFKKSSPPISNSISVQFTHFFESSSLNPEPISYFEISFSRAGNKRNQFYVGLSTEELHFNKYCGESAECNTQNFDDIFYKQSSRDDQIRVNFGAERFDYDIQNKLKDYYRDAFNIITNEKKVSTIDIKSLVHDYLINEGCINTLEAIDLQDEKLSIIKEKDQENMDLIDNQVDSGQMMLQLPKIGRQMRLNSMKEFTLSNNNNNNADQSMTMLGLEQQSSVAPIRNNRFLSMVNEIEEDNTTVFANDFRSRLESMAEPAHEQQQSQIRSNRQLEVKYYNYDLPLRKYPIISCSLHSIEFIKRLKDKQYQECLDYFQQNLSKYQYDYNIVSEDQNGRPELCNYFLFEDLSKSDYKPYVLGVSHNKQIADYVNQAIVTFEHSQKCAPPQPNKREAKHQSKLKRLISHTAMLIECVSDRNRYKIKLPSSQDQNKQCERHIGLKVPHHYLADSEVNM